MTEPRKMALSSAFENFQAAAWKRRLEREQLTTSSRTLNALERCKSGSSRLSLTPAPSPAPAKHREPNWTPLPPDSLPSLRSSSSGSLGSHSLEHGVSGLLNLPSSESLPTLIAPALSPSMSTRLELSGTMLRTPIFGESPSLRDLFKERSDGPPSRPQTQQSWFEQTRGRHGHTLSPVRLKMDEQASWAELPCARGFGRIERDRYYPQYVPPSRGMRRPGFEVEKPYRMSPGKKFNREDRVRLARSSSSSSSLGLGLGR